nr:AraC family transcriptional regulator [Microbulbifer celer]
MEEDLDIDQLCQVSHFSKYHFHRQCSAFFGMSVMALVKALRLKRAAYQLAYRDSRVVDIALANGYDSHEAFSRAFKKLFHKSPTDFRHSPDWTPWHTHYEPILTLRTKLVRENANFDVQIVDFPETRLAALEHRGAPQELGNTIRQFIEWRKANRLPPSKSRTFNLIYNDPNTVTAEDYRFDVACAIAQPLEENTCGIAYKVIPAGRCAVIRHIGSDDAIGVAVNYLYSEWLPQSDFEVRDFPIFFERVKFFPEVPENEMVTDIYLPVRWGDHVVDTL